MSAATAAPIPVPQETQVKETLISIIIAFVMAFVFRAFVIEAFIIPTGSMAPTLMGAQELFTSPETGYTWPVGPWWYDGDTPLASQGTASQPLWLHDPMTNGAVELRRYDERRRAGDRILVFKYLFGIYDPDRFHVVVFKAPHEQFAGVNYIKRLIGLPGEEVALIDGDVFTRKPAPGEHIVPGESWLKDGWAIRRKDERVQRAVWQPVFSSEYEPLAPTPTGFLSPWEGRAGWAIADRQNYQYSGKDPTTLTWNVARWPINDFYPYNETSDPRSFPNTGSRQTLMYPVSDVALACGVEPMSEPLNVAAVLRTRGQEFRAEIVGRDVTLKMGELGPARADGTSESPTHWTTLGTGTLTRPLEPGRITDLEFWHADQALWLFADGHRIAHGTYDWTPSERIHRSLPSLTLPEVIEADAKSNGNSLASAKNYHPAELVRWEFSGGPFTLHRVGLDRDLHYQAVSPMNPSGRPRATHPLRPLVLNGEQFFVCGDNSPASLDGRLWMDKYTGTEVDPWVASQIDSTGGVVPRSLMIGRAFFVYFPSLVRGNWSPLPMPDFGRMRFIW